MFLISTLFSPVEKSLLIPLLIYIFFPMTKIDTSLKNVSVAYVPTFGNKYFTFMCVCASVNRYKPGVCPHLSM